MTTWAYNGDPPSLLTTEERDGGWVVVERATGEVVDAQPRPSDEAFARARFMEQEGGW